MKQLVEQTHKTENCMRAEGAGALSDALKVNTTLTTLNLGGEQARQQFWHLSGWDAID